MCKHEKPIAKERISSIPTGSFPGYIERYIANEVVQLAYQSFCDPDFQKEFEKWHLETYGFPYVEDGVSEVIGFER